MQVTQVNDLITHAVIGGKKTIDFGISSSAEFYNILSSTLYKDQILAVVREVLCNAWDAHIEAGVTDKPVEVTLDQNKFVIKDFGTGIHLDDIGTIYGTYGNSTKKNDGKQTGGFGLGCKAPFAYTNHFEVISCHDGVKTIYSMSKSSASSNGKPEITVIASFPTTETGLQVSIPLSKTTDYRRFSTLINRIVRNGDMNMTFNGEAIRTLGFDNNQTNYFITTGSDVLLDVQHCIMIRYGNVIYPVEENQKIYEEYIKVVQHLKKISKGTREHMIIFQAPPHSISVTPSRESLSMQDHTVNTLNQIFAEFNQFIKTKFFDACMDKAKEFIQIAVNECHVKGLLSTEKQLPYRSAMRVNKIVDLKTMVESYMNYHYPETFEFRKADIQYRLEQMIQAGLLQKKLGHSYLTELKTFDTSTHQTNWLQRSVLAPLLVKLQQAKIDHTKLFVCNDQDTNVPYSYDRYSNKAALVEATKSRPRNLFEALPYLRNIIVVTTAKTDLINRCWRHKVFKELGQYQGFLVYYVGKKKEDKVNALAFFKATNMEVVDLTFKQEWEIPTVTQQLLPDVPKPVKKKGLVCLSSVIHPTLKNFDISYSKNEDAIRIEKPEFVMVLPVRQDISHSIVGNFNERASKAIVTLFGDKGGIAPTEPSYKKWIDAGTPSFMDYVVHKMCDYFENSSTLKEYWAYNYDRAMYEQNIYYTKRETLKIIYRSKALRDHFKLVNNLSDEDIQYLSIWNEFHRANRFSKYDRATKLKLEYDNIVLHPVNKELIDKFDDNPLSEIINWDQVINKLTTTQFNAVQKQKAMDIIIAVLTK